MQGLRGVPEEELGQPAPGQPHAGPKEKPGLALRANVLPAVPELLQVSTAQEPWVWPGEGHGPCQMLSLCGRTVHTSGVLCWGIYLLSVVSLCPVKLDKMSF